MHTGQPKGKEQPTHGLNTHVTGNSTNPRAIIVVYTDIFGLGLTKQQTHCRRLSSFWRLLGLPARLLQG